MNRLTHRQARQYMHANLDGLLNNGQRLGLEKHLAGCEACLAESESISTLTSRLQSEFHDRWDAYDGPSKHVMSNIRSQTRRINMSNKVNWGWNALGSVAVLVVLGVGLNLIFSQIRDHSNASSNTGTVTPVAEARPIGGLIIFEAMTDNGNPDLYTVHPDGSGMTNITSHPAHDGNPFWSPDGKRIAFQSDRSGSMQIFLMDADGTSITQVTDGEKDHGFNDGYSNPWSPDGKKLIITEREPLDHTDATPAQKWMLFTVDVSGQNKTPITDAPNLYGSPSWSPDGKHIAYIAVEPRDYRDVSRIYVVDADGDNTTNIAKLVPADEDLSFFNYTWTQRGRNIRFTANRYYWENDNGKYAVYEVTLDGATLIEIANTSTPLVDWWDGTTFVMGFTGETLTWIRADGYDTLKPFEKCQSASELQSSSFYSKRSSDGYLLFGAGCPNGEVWIYWANPKGTTVKQLFESPIKTMTGTVDGIFWSPDGEYATITVTSPGTNMYVIDLREIYEAPLTLPEPIIRSQDREIYNISWQPTP